MSLARQITFQLFACRSESVMPRAKMPNQKSAEPRPTVAQELHDSMQYMPYYRDGTFAILGQLFTKALVICNPPRASPTTKLSGYSPKSS
jgi:hypothetical protein